MKCNWALFCTTRDPRKAIKLRDRVAKLLGYEIEPINSQFDIDIPGYYVTFFTEMRSQNRNECILEAIEICERLGQYWQLQGSILEYLTLFCNCTYIPGVWAVECNFPPHESVREEEADPELV